MNITIYDHSSHPVMDHFIENYNRRNCIYYASDLFMDQRFTKEIAINYAISRARTACTALRIPLAEHFVSVYRSIDDEVYVDWKISSFAAYLTLINGDPSDALVARFQHSLFQNLDLSQVGL